MEISKENTHKCSKSYKTCNCCIQQYSCKKCRGICIFSRTSLKKFSTSKSFRKMVKERFYKREFEFLRSLKVAFPEPIDPVRFDESDTDDEEEEENRAQINEVYKLLQKFQQLSKHQKTMIGQVHCSDRIYSKPWEVTRLLKTNKGNKIEKLFYHCLNQKESKNGTRQDKIREYIYYGSNIYLDNSEKILNLPSFLEA